MLTFIAYFMNRYIFQSWYLFLLSTEQTVRNYSHKKDTKIKMSHNLWLCLLNCCQRIKSN